jgi:ribonuclease HI
MLKKNLLPEVREDRVVGFFTHFFRRLHSFNMAMIAKQGWNIMTKPNTLVAKLYKARYFPNSSLFDSQLGHNPSYAWRGIWKARYILMNGCRWSIGKGNDIKVMNDPWLRGKEGAWIQSPQVQGAFSIKVNDLMLLNEKRWDRAKIESLFPVDIVNRILDVPLLDMLEEDKLIWEDSTNGHYSVKSGYNLMLTMTGRLADDVIHVDWNCIWKIHAPPKAKHLFWRICRGCLPTRIRLQQRCVPCSLNCPLCDHGFEDDWHVFLDCHDSVQARLAAGLEQLITGSMQQCQTVKEIVLKICQSVDRNTAGLFAMLLWVLWNNRNNCVWNDTKEVGRNLGFKAKYMWEEWSAVQQCQQPRLTAVQQQHDRTWQQPPRGWYKCNVDAGFFDDLHKTSAGWCLRDYTGSFVMAGTLWNEGNWSTIEGESFALLEAMRAMVNRGITHVIFESDSKIVVDAIHTSRDGVSEFSSLICNIKNMLLANSNFVVKFVRRQANMVAHSLARAAISRPRRDVIDILPPCIATLLYNEII